VVNNEIVRLKLEDFLLKMDSDQCLRLINSDMKEFGTNRFDYILGFSMQTYSNAILNGIKRQNADIVDRLKVKMKLLESLPYMTIFSKVMYDD